MATLMRRYEEWRPVVVEEREVFTMTEAARRIGISASALLDLCLHGRMALLRDTREPNRYKQQRVLVKDVEHEIARRRSETGQADGRLKRKRGRPVG